MTRAKRSPEERLAELQKKQEQLKQKEKEMKRRISADARKADTHRKIEVGASVESVCHLPIEKQDLPKLIRFLKQQEDRGHYFATAMGYKWQETTDENGQTTVEYFVPDKEDYEGEKENKDGGEPPFVPSWQK